MENQKKEEVCTLKVEREGEREREIMLHKLLAEVRAISTF
jgi:hypothetical protein